MNKEEEEKRRSFLKCILAGTAAVIGTGSIVRPLKSESVQPVAHQDEKLYQESENFKKYYKTLR